MTGVEILAAQEVAVEFSFNWTIFWIIVAGITFAVLIYSCIDVCKGNCHWGLIPELTVVGLIGGMIIGSMFGKAAGRPIKYETLYKVTISDAVSMNDFLEKYEIVKTEGQIYTVRETKGE